MIHYHGTPCGGDRTQPQRFISGRHVLIPFSYPEDIGTAGNCAQSFILDNGAFTAWKQGKPITDWTEYYEWVRLWHRHPGFDWAIIPDVIDGTEADNDALIAEWELQGVDCGVPVWHYHESLERLDRLCRDYPRVALGSSGDWPNPGNDSWWRRTSDVMSVCCDSDGLPRAKLHGLRMLDPAIFSRLPLASADSTNAVRNANQVKRFGMYTPPHVGGRMCNIADRIESHQSAARWVPLEESGYLAFMETPVAWERNR